MVGIVYIIIGMFLYWKRLWRYNWHLINYISHVYSLLSTALFSIPVKHHQNNKLNNNSKIIPRNIARHSLKFLSSLLPTLGFLKTTHTLKYSRTGPFVRDGVSLCCLRWPQTCGFKLKSSLSFLRVCNYWIYNAAVFWLFFLTCFIK